MENTYLLGSSIFQSQHNTARFRQPIECSIMRICGFAHPCSSLSRFPRVNKTSSLNMPIIYTTVIQCGDWQANAQPFTRCYHTKQIVATYDTHAWTVNTRWSRRHPCICHAWASHAELCVCVKRSFVTQEKILKYSCHWTISGWNHTWFSAHGFLSPPKSKTAHQWLFTAPGSIGQREKC